jgi:HopA1 effector protein family
MSMSAFFRQGVLAQREEVPPYVQEQLAPLLQVVVIDSLQQVRFGELDPFLIPLPNLPSSAQTAHADTEGLCTLLNQLIYNFAYARATSTATKAFIADNLGQVLEDSAFVAILSAANRSRERWDRLWNVYEVREGGAISVEKRGSNKLVLPGHYLLTEAVGRPPSVGDSVSIHVPRESKGVQPGFYFAFGETVASDYDDAHLSRFYFNVGASEAAWLNTFVSTLLNRYRIPYRMKCLAQPGLYERRDSAVLYVAKRFVPVILKLLEDQRDVLTSHLREGVPLLTKQLARGIGAADEPGSSKSFGQSRSQLVSEGIVDAWVNGKQGVDARLEAIRVRFARNRLSLATPHLAAGSSDMYSFHGENTQDDS